jgi:hypothetical protein
MKKSTILKRLLSAITIMVLVSNSWLIPEKIYASSESTEVLDSESYGSESKSVTKDKSGDYVQMFDCKFTVHEHTEECYDDKHNLICGKADFVVHTHDKNCYNSNGILVCKLPEIEEHTHDETCYGGVEDEEEEQQDIDVEDIGDTVIIMEEPIPLKKDNLTCQKREIQLHTHTMICLDENGNLVCGKLEVISHQHTVGCFKTVKKVTKHIPTSTTDKQQTKSETITNTIIEEKENDTQDTEIPDTEETKPKSENPFGVSTIIWIIILILAVAIISRCIIYRRKRRE